MASRFGGVAIGQPTQSRFGGVAIDTPVALEQVEPINQPIGSQEAGGNLPSIFQVPKDAKEQEQVKAQHKQIVDDFLGNMRKRGGKLFDIALAGSKEEQSGLETIGQALLNSVGGAGLDILGQAGGEVLKGSFRALPDSVQKDISEEGVALLETPAGKLGLKALEAGGQEWEKLKQEQPRVARNIEAIATGVAVFTPVGTKSLFGTAKEAGGEFVGLVKKGVTDTKQKLTATGGVDEISPAQQMKQFSSGLYDEVDKLKANTTPAATNELLESFKTLQPRSEKAKILAGDTEVDTLIERFNQFEGQTVTLKEADELDKILGAAVTKHYTIKGLDSDGKAILEMQEKFRNHITNPKREHIEGDDNAFALRQEAVTAWSKSKLLDDIETIETNAALTDNPATARKSGYRTLIRNKKRFNKYTKQEKNIIMRGAKGGKIDNLLRTTIGSRLLSTIVGSGGGAAGVAASTALSAAARGVADAGGARVTKSLQKEIINRSAKRNPLRDAIKESK